VRTLILAEGVAIALLGLLVVGLLRSHAEIVRALHQLGVSGDPSAPEGDDRTSTAPARTDTPGSDVVGTTPSGEAVSIGVAGASQATLLAFLSTGCSSCNAFWMAFDRDDLEIPGDARLVIVTRGPEDESESQVRALSPRNVTVVMSSDSWEAYRVAAAPYFVYVDGPSGRVVGEGAAGTWDHVANLMRQALGDAGLAERRARPRPVGPGTENLERVDRDLAAAGIHPGHPSLYQPLFRDAESEE
jgi:hypothetical protein